MLLTFTNPEGGDAISPKKKQEKACGSVGRGQLH